MQFVHFTRPNGTKVPIVPAQIVDLQEPIGQLPIVKTVIILTNGSQAVRETEAEIEAILAKA